jgi:hypothetical protein
MWESLKPILVFVLVIHLFVFAGFGFWKVFFRDVPCPFWWAIFFGSAFVAGMATAMKGA